MDRKLFRSILFLLTYAITLVAALVHGAFLIRMLTGGLTLLRPLLAGFAVAFVLYRPCLFFSRLYGRILPRTKAGLARGLAIATAYLALLFCLCALFSFVVPRLMQSLEHFVGSLNFYVTNLQTWTNDFLSRLHLESLDLTALRDVLNQLFRRLLALLSDLGPHLLELTQELFSMAMTTALSLVFSIYMLSGRERLLRQCRRMLDAYVPKAIAAPVLDVVHLTADTFSRFITGQLIEAGILGALCTIGMLFIQADYALLIGTVIGTSALIPVAGAYVGAIVSALLLLIVSPIRALIFLIFLVILQQVEGNLIYPRVVGSSIGLPGIWVLAAVTIGGKLMGLTGILFSVPTASVLYALLKQDIRRRLDR